MPETTDLSYLRTELRFTAAEWTKLTDDDKATLRRWAREEMTVLGITIKQ